METGCATLAVTTAAEGWVHRGGRPMIRLGQRIRCGGPGLSWCFLWTVGFFFFWLSTSNVVLSLALEVQNVMLSKINNEMVFFFVFEGEFVFFMWPACSPRQIRHYSRHSLALQDPIESLAITSEQHWDFSPCRSPFNLLLCWSGLLSEDLDLLGDTFQPIPASPQSFVGFLTLSRTFCPHP